MANELTRLQQEITQLQEAITALANLPDTQKPLQAQLDAKRRDLAKLTGASTPAAGNLTTIHGDVSGTVMSGSFSGPVTLGPQIHGPVSAGRDVNVATEQIIYNQGDRIRVGDISGSSGIAIGRGAQSTVRTINTAGGDYAEGTIDKRKETYVSGDQIHSGNTFANISGSNINVGSALTNVTQSIGAASHLSTQDADQLQKLVEQLSAELQQHAAQYPKETAEVTKRTESAVAEATKAEPDQDDVTYSLDRLKKAATNIAVLIPTVLPIATQIADTIRKITAI